MNFGLLCRRQWHIRLRGPGILPVVPNAMLLVGALLLPDNPRKALAANG